MTSIVHIPPAEAEQNDYRQQMNEIFECKALKSTSLLDTGVIQSGLEISSKLIVQNAGGL